MNTKKRLSIRTLLVVILCLALCVSAFALGYTFLRVEGNVFGSGNVDIALTESDFVIDGNSTDTFLFEPGMRAHKIVSIENKSSDPDGVWYKLYFDNIDGDLSDVIQVTVYDGSTEVLSGKLAALGRANIDPMGKLALNEMREFTVEFYYPDDLGNAGAGSSVTFVIRAEAVQVRNNPTGLFN